MAQKIIGEVVSCGSYPGAKVRCCLEVEMIDNGAKVKCRWRPFGEHWNGYGSSATLAVSHTTAGPRKEVTATSQISYVSNDWREAYAPKIGWQEKDITKGEQEQTFTVSAYYNELSPSNSDVSYTFKVPSKGMLTFKFNSNGGTPCDTFTHNGKGVTLPPTERVGYTFAGWQANGKLYQPWIAYDFTKSTTFIAKWELIVVNCTIHKNDGSGFTKDQQKITETSLKLPMNWTRENYMLLGFTDTSDGTGELYKDWYRKERYQDFDLYAKWGAEAKLPIVSLTDVFRCNYNGVRDNEGTGWRINFAWQQYFKLGDTEYQNGYKIYYECHETNGTLVHSGTENVSGNYIYHAGGLSPSKTYKLYFKLYHQGHNDYYTEFEASLGTSAQPLDFYAIGSTIKVGINATAGESTYDPDVKLGGKVDCEMGLTIGGENIFDLIYPVGCYYWSSSSTNPGTLFGGSWERIRDRFVYAAGSYSVDSTGGEEEVTLSVSEMPSHDHTVYNGNSTVGSDGAYAGLFQTNVQSGSGWYVYSNGKNGIKHLITDNTGGGQAHNNMPPYIVAYCWHRIG